MNAFEYHNPTRVIFGEGQIAKIDQYVPHDKKVLVLYGGGSAKRTGTLDEVLSALGEREVHQFGGIEPNPQFATLMRAVALVKEHNIDCLLAVGGGSVIDGTKFIAAAACFDGDPWEILVQHGANIERALPLASVLTIPATGSEMNSGGVVTHAAKQAKLSFMSPLLFPVFSIIDPAKTLTLPPRQVANGVVDAFVHVLEQYLTAPMNAKVQDRYAEGLLLTLIEEGPKALSAPDDLAVRANVAWAATNALNGLIGRGVAQDWSTHMIGHELTALYGIDHARTLAIVLFGVWAHQRDAKAAKLLQYAERVWGITQGSDDEKIDAAIARTEQFFHDLGVATRLSDYDLGDEKAQDAPEKVRTQLAAHGMSALGEQRDITPADAAQIIAQRL